MQLHWSSASPTYGNFLNFFTLQIALSFIRAESNPRMFGHPLSLTFCISTLFVFRSLIVYSHSVVVLLCYISIVYYYRLYQQRTYSTNTAYKYLGNVYNIETINCGLLNLLGFGFARCKGYDYQFYSRRLNK